jgi:hypothetical protein
MWQLTAFLTTCRRDEADEAVDRYGELARRLEQPALLTHAAAYRAMRELLDGRWAAAEAAAEEVLAVSGGTGVALQEHGVELLILRGEQCRMGELAERLEAYAQRFTELPAWHTCVIWALVQGGRADEAQAKLEALRLGDYAALPRDVNFDPGVAMLAHAAAELGDARLASEMEPFLRPSADYWIVYGIGAATLGPAAYSLGLCSLLTGRVRQAVEDFELALDKSRRMRCRPYEAHSALGLARALEHRDEPGDADRAAGLRSTAVAIAEELEMTRLLRDALSAPSPKPSGW